MQNVLANNDDLTRAIVGGRMKLVLGKPSRSGRAQHLGAAASEQARKAQPQTVQGRAHSPEPRQPLWQTGTWRTILLGSASAVLVGAAITGGVALYTSLRKPADQGMPIDQAGPAVRVLEIPYTGPAVAQAPGGLPLGPPLTPAGTNAAPEARAALDANPGLVRPDVGAPMPTPLPAGALPTPQALPSDLAARSAGAAGDPRRAAAATTPASAATPPAQSTVIIDETSKQGASGSSPRSASVLELAKPEQVEQKPAPAKPATPQAPVVAPAKAAAPSAPATPAPAPAKPAAPSAPAAVTLAPDRAQPKQSAPAAPAAPPLQSAAAQPQTPPQAQPSVAPQTPAAAAARIAAPAIDRPAAVVAAEPVPAVKITIVDIAQDSKTALVTNPSTRLPMRVGVGEKLPNGETITAIDAQSAEIRTASRTYKME